MKRTVQDNDIGRRLAEGQWTLRGCLGEDPLGIERIEIDRAKLQDLGLDLVALGRALESLWQTGAERFGATADIAPGLSVKVDEAKGRIACPFSHPGTYPKGVMTVVLQTKQLRFSPLSIHLMTAHCFLGGLGSAYRVAPGDLAAISHKLARQS